MFWCFRDRSFVNGEPWIYFEKSHLLLHVYNYDKAMTMAKQGEKGNCDKPTRAKSCPENYRAVCCVWWNSRECSKSVIVLYGLYST